ncbi:hypothetical protein NM208_g3356 [Fusarium decemcellulare]|uniref:Uncharacterized protein n=1 Tax=Fusarium decemcellulare TaxID=57161 RepID=A0ACC1SPT6_9HYPO|nr:hypothetical protein NM208_g3356 [Fusarium decemcellulare]
MTLTAMKFPVVTLIAALASHLEASTVAQDLPHVGHLNFEGKFLVAISDADMVSSAYADGLLGPIQGSDTLSVIRLSEHPSQWEASSVPVGNSVVGPPAALAVTPDGQYAIVTETVGPRPAGNVSATMQDLPTSRNITVIDLSDLDNPRVVQVLEVSINLRQSLYELRSGRLSLLSTPDIPGWTTGNLLMDARFHTILNVLALTDNSEPRLFFAEVVGTGDGISLKTWGNSVALERSPFSAKFSPNGEFVFSNAMYTGLGPEAPRGTISSIQLNASQDASGAPQHSLVSRAQVGVMPEGLAISPDGQWAVTANLERSTPALDSPDQGFFSSLSLLRVDTETGALDTVGTYAFDGILPEGVVFDTSSRFVAATTFDQYDGRSPGGSIDFWRISGDHADVNRIEFVKTSYSVPVTRGAHSISLVG